MAKLKRSKRAKQWTKGQSAASNPSTTKHREEASRRTRKGGRSDGGNLTVEAMAEHDENVAESLETKSIVSMGTIETEFASGAYDGTPFESIRRLWGSSLPIHREICAVLAALTEVIRDKKGTLSPREYFASLMTALETAEGDETVTALAYLLSIVIASIPKAILQSKFSLSCKILLDKVTPDSSTSLTKSIIKCLGTLLAVQEKAVWTEPSTVHIFHSVLSHSTSTKPKVRTAASEVCRHVVEKSASTTKAPSSEAADYCVRLLETESSGSVTLFHVLALLKQLIVYFSPKNLKSTCEHLLKILTQGQAHLSDSVMNVFRTLFTESPASLTAQLNAQLINALHDCQPSIQDNEPSCVWLSVMEKAHVCLQKENASLCISHLPLLFSKSLSYLSTSFSKSIETAADVMKSLLQNCVQPHIDSGAVPFEHLTKIFNVIENGLKYRYQSAWDKVFDVMRAALLVMGKPRYRIVKSKSLQSLCSLHETPGFSLVSELRAALGAAFETMGPKVVLEAVPLGFEETDVQKEFPRSWLLLVMKNHVHHTELEYFVDVLLPLAARLRDKAALLNETGHLLEAKLYEQLQMQIWAILPGFCTCPTDLAKSFKRIAKVLGVALSNRPDLRTPICRSLSLLIEKNRENDKYCAELARFAQNYLPILFNIQTEKSKSSNVAVLTCIGNYLSIADTKLVNSLFGKVGVKLVSSESDVETKLSIMDLAIAMVPFIDSKGLIMLYKAIEPLLVTSNPSLQKRTYKLVEAICNCESDGQKSFVASHLSALRDALVNASSVTLAASKRIRMKCLSHVASSLTEKHDFLTTILPEVILCTKEVNEDTRTSAFQLLVDLAAILSSGTNSKEAVTKYFHMVLAGLAASSPHMLSATILALGRLVYEFNSVLSDELLEKLLDAMKFFLTSKSREVVKSTLGFLKVTVHVLEVENLAPHVQDLIDSIVSWSKDKSYHFRTKSKFLFERLIRKLGYEMVYKMVPESHRKLIVNIRKTSERSKRLKSKGKANTEGLDRQRKYETLLDSSDEGSENDDSEAVPKKARFKKAWIKESEDEPVDFLDAGVVKKVLASKPRERSRSRKVDDDFSIAEDGKIIVSEENTGAESKKEDEKMARINRKRQRLSTDAASDSENDEDADSSPAKRPALGIHRKLESKPKEKAVSYGAEYKAKKARGDVKIPGKADPYAYVPLDARQLNRRKKAKLSGQFKGLMTAAKRGGQIGRKQQARFKVRLNRSKKRRH